MTILAELTMEGIGAGVIGTVVVALVILFVVLQRLQDGRKVIAEELRRELKAGSEPQPVEVQSPLTVTPHIEYTPLDDHRRLAAALSEHKQEVDRRFEAISKASSDGREKIYNLIRVQAEASAEIGRETSSKVDALSGKFEILNQQLQQINLSILQSAAAKK